MHQKCFKKFKSSDFNINEILRFDHLVEIHMSYIKAIVELDLSQNVSEIVKALSVSNASVGNNLHQQTRFPHRCLGAAEFDKCEFDHLHVPEDREEKTTRRRKLRQIQESFP